MIEEIARGASAVIYRARLRNPERILALKVFKGLALDDLDRARFKREVSAITKLRHPGIVALLDYGEENGELYLAMENVEGEDLAARFRRGYLDFQELAQTVASVAGAIHYANQKGILHRDVKPANLLLDANGSAYVADFGLAWDCSSSVRLTQTGHATGTPAYMSPEQARSRPNEVLIHTDVYSLGVVLYEGLTGRVPFPGKDTFEVLARVQTDDPTPPRRLRPKVPVELETICVKCLAKEPRDRYATALDLSRDLRLFLDGEQPLAVPAGPVARAVRWVRRRPEKALTIGALAMATCVAAVAYVWGISASSRARAVSAQAEASIHLTHASTELAAGHATDAVPHMVQLFAGLESAPADVPRALAEPLLDLAADLRARGLVSLEDHVTRTLDAHVAKFDAPARDRVKLARARARRCRFATDFASARSKRLPGMQ